MATLLRAQVSIPRDGGLPEDDSMNTWHFWSEAVDRLDDCAVAFDGLRIFYQTIDGILSSKINGAMNVKFYDLSDLVPRPPIFLDNATLTPGSSAPLPSEVAICLSFRGPALAGAIPARNRGRIFLGPLDSSVMDTSTADSIVDSGITGAIANAAETFRTGFGATTVTWSVFSPTIAGAPPWSPIVLAASTAFVEEGHVDNAFDTIRSRGASATGRANFP